jgi:hypothetical protein
MLPSALSQLAWAHELLLWASKGSRSTHTFNYDLINSTDQNAQVSSVWSIPAVPKTEKLHGYHPTQKPLRLLRRAMVVSSTQGELVFDPFSGSGSSGVASKELGRFFVGAEKEEEYAHSLRGAEDRRSGACRGVGRDPRPQPKGWLGGGVHLGAYRGAQMVTGASSPGRYVSWSSFDEALCAKALRHGGDGSLPHVA